MPVKPLHAAKTRLRGAADHGVGDPDAHAALALALAHDTVAAVLAARAVRRLLVISSDPVVAAELAAVGVEVAPDVAAGSTPPSCTAPRSCARPIRARPSGRCRPTCPRCVRPNWTRPCTTPPHSSRAVRGGRSARTRRARGTTLLLAAAGAPLDPRFGASSAARHRASGAVPLAGRGPGLRRDVDTGDDLCAAAELGLGPHTRAVLAPTGRC